MSEQEGGQGLVRYNIVSGGWVASGGWGMQAHTDGVYCYFEEAAARIAALEMERDEVKAREMERAITEPVAYRWMAPDYSGFMYGIAHGDLPEHCRPIPLYAEPQGPPDLEGTVTFLGKALVKATAATVAERQAREAAEARLREAEKDAERAEGYEDALRQIVQWADAYPKEVFKEPDWQLVRAALECAGISIDAVSASNMRHVVDGVGKIARAAIDAAHHVPVPTLICPKCGADRYKVPCGHYAGWHPDCPMAGTAAIDAAKDGGVA